VAEDRELVERLLSGDPAAFRELVEAYKKKMYYFVLDMIGDRPMPRTSPRRFF